MSDSDSNGKLDLIISLHEELRADLRRHFEADEKVWEKVHAMSGVISFVKWVVSPAAVLALIMTLTRWLTRP